MTTFKLLQTSHGMHPWKSLGICSGWLRHKHQVPLQSFFATNNLARSSNNEELSCNYLNTLNCNRENMDRPEVLLFGQLGGPSSPYPPCMVLGWSINLLEIMLLGETCILCNSLPTIEDPGLVRAAYLPWPYQNLFIGQPTSPKRSGPRCDLDPFPNY